MNQSEISWIPSFNKMAHLFWVMDTHWLRWRPALQTSEKIVTVAMKISVLLAGYDILYIQESLQSTPQKKTHPKRQSPVRQK